MTLREIDEKVQLLRAGQVVEINDLCFRAKSIEVPDGDLECLYCSVDCMCKGDIPEVCMSLETRQRPHWILEIVGL